MKRFDIRKLGMENEFNSWRNNISQDIKVGDRVLVSRKARQEEHDLWMDAWVEPMDDAVGEKGVVKHIVKNKCIISFDNPRRGGYCYPLFVLKKL